MKQFIRENALLVATVTAVVLGVIVGALCRPLHPSSNTILLVGFPGEILLRMLKMLTLPLIITSIVTGVGNLQGASAGRMGVLSVLYYFGSSFIALLIALTLALTIRPGALPDEVKTEDAPSDSGGKISGLNMFLDLLRNTVPDNIVRATLQHSRTVETAPFGGWVDKLNASEMHENGSADNSPGESNGITTKTIKMFDGANIIGVLVFCVVFGIILRRKGRQGLVVARFFAGLNTIILQMIRLVIWYSPVGIMFLIASQVMASKDLSITGHTLGIYIATEMSGIAAHLLIALPLFYFTLTRRNAYKVYMGILQALFTALATCSSAATLPVTMQCVEKKLKMDGRVAGFVLPIGATVNMDGAAIYFVMGPVFIAQYNGISLSFPDLLIISLTAMLSSVGTAAIPGSGMALLLLVLNTIGLPDRGIFLLLSIDWLVDRFTTVVNVASDCLALGVASHYTVLHQEEVDETDETETKHPDNAMPPPQETEETEIVLSYHSILEV